MKRILPVDELARDERFERIKIEDVIFDPRNASNSEKRQTGFRIDNEEAPDGLAIDVFNTMRDFGDATSDPVLYFCEDWMLADEVTHVKMGSDWLRRLTDTDPERRQQALDFQRAVDKLFSFGGFRGEDDESPVHLARKFRSLAGFSEEEITELVDTAAEAFAEAQAMQAAAAANA